MGEVKPVDWIPMCTCPRQPPPKPALVPKLCSCCICGDVLPEKAAERIGEDHYCPTCFDKPLTDPATLVADLLDLQEELRPTDRDGA